MTTTMIMTMAMRMTMTMTMNSDHDAEPPCTQVHQHGVSILERAQSSLEVAG